MSIQSSKYFSPNAEIFRWGPIPGRYFYISDFIAPIFHQFVEKYNCTPWPETLALFQNGRMVWLNGNKEIVESGKEIFNQLVLPAESRGNLYREYEVAVKELNYFYSKINPEELDSLSNDSLVEYWQSLIKKADAFWVPTIPPELGNYGSPSILNEKLGLSITNPKERDSALEILTSPEALSFYQQEEVALSLTTDVERHQQQYFWLKNSYNGVQILPVEYFTQRKKELHVDIEEKLSHHLDEIKAKKEKIIQKYKLPAETVEIANVLREAIEWQDDRKKHIFIIEHYKELFCNQAVKRYGYSHDELHNLGVTEIMSLFSGKNVGPIIARRKNGFGFHIHDTFTELTSAETNFCWTEFAEEKVTKLVTEFSGIVASKGPLVRGKVTILLDPHDLESFPEGNILVCPMTSPEYVFAMKKSSAILTDTGGLTSHAAIVSRELKKPCIIGTKLATRVLKNNDEVEVDTEKGIVRILSTKTH